MHRMVAVFVQIGWPCYWRRISGAKPFASLSPRADRRLHTSSRGCGQRARETSDVAYHQRDTSSGDLAMGCRDRTINDIGKRLWQLYQAGPRLLDLEAERLPYHRELHQNLWARSKVHKEARTGVQGAGPRLDGRGFIGGALNAARIKSVYSEG